MQYSSIDKTSDERRRGFATSRSEDRPIEHSLSFYQFTTACIGHSQTNHCFDLGGIVIELLSNLQGLAGTFAHFFEAMRIEECICQRIQCDTLESSGAGCARDESHL